MCEQDVFDGGILVVQDGLEGRDPAWFALARVDKDSVGTGADEVGVRAYMYSLYVVARQWVLAAEMLLDICLWHGSPCSVN